MYLQKHTDFFFSCLVKHKWKKGLFQHHNSAGNICSSSSEIFVLVHFLVQGSFGRAASESLLVEEKLESETSDESVPCKM